MDKVYFFMIVAILFIFLIYAILKKEVKVENEHFLGTYYNKMSNMLSQDENIKEGISNEESENDTKLNDEKINALIQQNVKQSLANLKMPSGVKGDMGPIGPSGGLFINKGYLTSNKNIKKLKPMKMVTALKPIGDNGSPVMISDSQYTSDKKWIMNANGTITNQYLGENYCLKMNNNKNTEFGKYGLLELSSTENGKCTQFQEDKHSRLKIKNTNTCMTIKNTDRMKDLSLPNTKKCSMKDIKNKKCFIEEEMDVLGISQCSDTVDKDQTFIWM